MIVDFLIGIFIAAARNAARWPQPHRKLAQQALGSITAEHAAHFEPEIEAAIELRDEVRAAYAARDEELN